MSYIIIGHFDEKRAFPEAERQCKSRRFFFLEKLIPKRIRGRVKRNGGLQKALKPARKVAEAF